MSDPHPLDYAPAQQRRPLHVVALTIMTIQATVYLAVPMLALIFVVPKFEMTFKDFAVELPGLTKIVLRLSRWAANGYGWIFLPALIAAVVIPGVLIDRRSETGLGLKIYRAVFIRLLLLLAILLTAAILLACYLPMMNLVNAISGAGK